MRRVLRGIVLLVIAGLLASCLGVGMETRFNADGSGEITMKIRVSQALLEMGEEQTDVPVPISREELEAAYADVDGVTVIEVKEEQTDEDLVIIATIGFDDYSALSNQDDFVGAGAELIEEGGKTIYRITVGEIQQGSDDDAEEEDGSSSDEKKSEEGSSEGDAEMEEAMKAMMMSFMEGYSIEYRVVAPRRIVSHTHGELSADGLSVEFEIPMGDYISLEEPYVFEVVW